MSFEIKIGTGSEEVTIDVKDSANFQMSTVQNMRDDGSLRFLDTVFAVAGTVKAATDELITDRTFLLFDMVARDQPQRIQIIQNGGLKREFLPVDFLGTPKVRLFQTKPDDGAGINHWPFQFEIFMREGSADAPGGVGGSVFTTVRNVTVEKFQSAFVRKIWNIKVTASTRAQGRAFIRTKIPTVTPLRVLITDDPEEGSVSGQFIWEATKGEVIEFVENPAVVNPGTDHTVEQLLVQDEDPVLHRARRRPHLIKFSGRIRGVHKKDGTPPVLKPPQPHLAIGGKIFKAPSPRQIGGPVLVDGRNGIYELVWEENYKVTSRAIPEANHTGHDAPFALAEPSDGGFFS